MSFELLCGSHHSLYVQISKKKKFFIKELGFLRISADEKPPASETTLLYTIFLEIDLKLLFLLRNATVPVRQEVLVKS